MKIPRCCTFLILVLAFTTGLALQPAAAEYVVLGKDAEPLRTAFNADVGKIRVMMLVSPT